MTLASKQVAGPADVIAPDGSEVRILCGTARGGMALFSLQPKAISKAIVHRTIDEVWYFVSGHGQMWRKLGDAEVIEDVGPGLSVALPVGTHFQFRADDLEPLVIVGATMPPWPGMDEAMFVEGIWDATGADHLSRDGRAQNGNKKSRRVLFRSSSKHRHGRA